YNTGKDTGYSKNNEIEESDIHNGWTLGKFSVSGYTDINTENADHYVFTKSADSKLDLYFELNQDINALNGNEHLSINEDTNGSDKNLNVSKTNFGQGALIVKRNNPFNSDEEAVVITNFLSEKAKRNESILAYEFNDGEYKVNLDYEIKETDGKKTKYTNYKISFSFTVQSEENDNSSETRYSVSNGAVNTGHDNGFSGENKITGNDPHFGYEVGEFFVKGFTSYADDDKTNPVFLKNVGDQISLWFNIKHDIADIKGDGTLKVNSDGNGYDEYFGIEKTDFGKGMLIIRKTNYQNVKEEPILFNDYLVAKASESADTEVYLFEEGDYEVALDYELKNASSLFPSYHNYRIFFKFSVRNSNCMIFPFDSVTKAELINSSITPNGFYLDLAKSRYLDINVKKAVLVPNGDDYTEDIRFNKSAKDGDQYTDEGVYYITVNNKYTGEQTSKTIYVGTDPVLQAHYTTNLPIAEIKSLLSQGAVINEKGEISLPQTGEEITEPMVTSSETALNTTNLTVSDNQQSDDKSTENNNAIVLIIAIAAAIIILAVIMIVVTTRKRKSTNTSKSNTEQNEEKENQ
ncbi:MAG: hypothetical protein K2J79_11120, partial [Ruminiclostridium sp.]|nr:hypothetical protein [Ruminiclostridium sp.]